MEASRNIGPKLFRKIGYKIKVIVLTVYVDDFILAGPGSNDEWGSIRDKANGVRTTVPTPVGRVLGVHHHFTQNGTKIETEIDMVDYVNQSVEMYCSHVGSKQWPIKEKVHYPWYEPTQL